MPLAMVRGMATGTVWVVTYQRATGETFSRYETQGARETFAAFEARMGRPGFDFKTVGAPGINSVRTAKILGLVP